MTPPRTPKGELPLPQKYPPLLPFEVQVWRLELPTPLSQLDSILSLLPPEEQARAARIRHAQTRAQFLLGRSTLRQLLAHHLALAPADLPLALTPFGKPFLDLPRTDLHFNLTHSQDTLLLALCRGAAVGIDLEHTDRNAGFMEIAHHSFTMAETAHLSSITALTPRKNAFFQLWTRKESLLKADGRGLSLPMSSFEIPSTLNLTLAGKRFTLYNLPNPPNQAAALALQTSTPYQVRHHNFRSIEAPHSHAL